MVTNGAIQSKISRRSKSNLSNVIKQRLWSKRTAVFVSLTKLRFAYGGIEQLKFTFFIHCSISRKIPAARYVAQIWRQYEARLIIPIRLDHLLECCVFFNPIVSSFKVQEVEFTSIRSCLTKSFSLIQM